MYQHPDEILQFAHLVAEECAKKGLGARSRCARVVWVRLNGRKPELITTGRSASQPRPTRRWRSRAAHGAAAGAGEPGT
jgi:hypothetical protein